MNRKWGCAIRNPSPKLSREVDGGNAHTQGKIGDISATGHPIHLMFGSMAGFSGSTDRMALFPLLSLLLMSLPNKFKFLRYSDFE